MIRFLICFGLFAFCSSHAQAQKFVSKENKWIVSDNWARGAGQTSTPYFYWFKDEVEIDGQEYLQLYNAKNGVPEFLPQPKYYREEEGKVFMYHEWVGMEREIYDFNLNLGDTITLAEDFIVAGIDTLNLLDGNKTRSYELNYSTSNSSFSSTLIEGVGLEPFDPSVRIVDYWHYLDCFYRNNVLTYSGATYCTDFGTTAVSNESYNEVKLRLSDGTVSVSGIATENLSISLYTLTGQLMQSLHSSSGYFSGVQNMQEGMIVCQLLDDGRPIHSQLLLID